MGANQPKTSNVLAISDTMDRLVMTSREDSSLVVNLKQSADMLYSIPSALVYISGSAIATVDIES